MSLALVLDRMTPPRRAAGARARQLALVVLLGLVALVGACGGGGGGEPAPQQDPPPTLVTDSGPQRALAGGSATFSVGASGATTYQWQKFEAGQWLDIPGASGATLTLSNVSGAMSGTQFRVIVSNAAGSVTSASFTLTVETPVAAPLVTAHPADVIAVEGSSATLTVAATGDAIAFTWELSSDGGATWLPVAGATGSTLVLPNVALADSGKRYRAVASNRAGSAASNSARLTVTPAPVAPTIATQPANQNVNPGQGASFSVGALGTDLTYQWQASTDGGLTWAPLPGATASTITLNNVALSDHGKRFRAVIGNSLGSITSAAATLSVTAVVVPVAITAQPTSQTVNEGQTAVFTVAASGTAPSYQWQVSPDSGISWSAVGGGVAANAATLSLPGVQLSDSGKLFRAVVSNGAGPVTSQPATLTVKANVTAPVITGQPVGVAKIVGQAASFSVAATATGATPTYQWEKSPSGSGPWSAITGATGASYSIAAVAIGDDATHLRAKVATPVGTIFSAAAALQVSWGSVETSADTSQLESFGGSGDGGSPGGGDGAGTDGGGGLGKTVNALLTVTRLTDGALIGQALTHPTSGLVKIKAGPGAAPLLLTLRGNDKARYYDEGRVAQGVSPVQAMLPFGADQELHALVDQLDENLGVTPLTEAAYRYAINQFIVDPQRVADGLEPLRRTATAQELSRLTAAQIRAANARILKEINSRLPEIYALESLKALPTPVDGGAASDALKLSRYGRQQAVTGGLVAAAGLFKKTDERPPALLLAEQIARDLTDGTIDGYALDGSLASDKDSPVYDPIRLPVDLSMGANQQSERFGVPTLYPLVPDISEVGEQWSTYDNECPRWRDQVSLLKDGSVRVARVEYSESKTPPPRCEQTSKTTVQGGFATGVRQLQSNGYQGFLLQNNGTVLGWGNATCGMLGTGVLAGVVDKPTPIPALAKLTSIAIGTYAVAARDAAGQVFTFGSNADGALGFGPRPPGAVDCMPPGQTKPLLTVLTPQRLTALQDTVSLHVVRGATFYAVRPDGLLWGWGSGAAMAFGGDVTAPRDVPAAVSGLKAVRSVGGTRDATFALLTKGLVVGWGSNADGGFGDGTATPKLVPTTVPLGNVVVQDLVTDGAVQAIALLDDGSVLAWGPAYDTIDPLTGRQIRQPARRPAPLSGPGGTKIRHIQLGNGPDAVIYLLAQDGKVFKLDGLRKPFEAVEVTAGFR
ncbi:MAG: hypothetical protein JNN03_01810 [Rubrivivax sp.]|nr:hypothetical protein [Rubrivivax sp.]